MTEPNDYKYTCRVWIVRARKKLEGESAQNTPSTLIVRGEKANTMHSIRANCEISAPNAA